MLCRQASCRKRSVHSRTRFFADRILFKDLCKAATAAKSFEAQHEGMRFTFLTVTNRGSANLNASRLQLDYTDATNQILRGEGLPSDPSAAVGPVVFQHGMRVRMTHNVDKDRDFVNGNGGVVEHVLDLPGRPHLGASDHSEQSQVHASHVRLCDNHPTSARGDARRCGLVFRQDQTRSRVWLRRRIAVYVVGKVRRTDWLPVGGDKEGGEQEHLSVMSESSCSGDQPDEDDMCFCAWDEDSSVPDDDGMGVFGVAGDDEDDDDDDAMSDDDPKLYRARAWDIDPDEFNASERSGLFG